MRCWAAALVALVAATGTAADELGMAPHDAWGTHGARCVSYLPGAPTLCHMRAGAGVEYDGRWGGACAHWPTAFAACSVDGRWRGGHTQER